MPDDLEKDVVNSSLLLKLILNEAIFRANAAQALIKYKENEFPHSLEIGDSDYLLRLFSIELFIKCIFLYETKRMHYTHNVEKIFYKLKEETQDKILNIYNANSHEVITKNKLHLLLKKIGGYIVKIRYPFEDFIKMNNSDYEELLEKFENSPTGDFTFSKIIYEYGSIISLLDSLKTYCLNIKIE